MTYTSDPVDPRHIVFPEGTLLSNHLKGSNFACCSIENSDLNYEHGIVRGDDSDFTDWFLPIDKLNYVGFCNFCMEKGKPDNTRHGAGATTWSLDVGIGDHNFGVPLVACIK